MKKYLKLIIALGILVATVGAFGYYVAHHPEVIDRLKTTSPASLALLLELYGVWFGALVLVTRISLRMFGKHLSRQENILFNAYSTLINFFGPGQSGPVFRGAYLKKRHGLQLKHYMITTLMYYGFYIVISAFFMFVGNRPWWQTCLAVIVAAGGSAMIMRWYGQKKAKLGQQPGINALNIGLLFGATLLQLTAQAAIYAVELTSSGVHAGLGQVLAYTGVANLALFVALTPGAIGIREAFLVFTQGLHGFGNLVIVAANLIDRAVYLVFLGLLFVAVLAMHAKDKLHIAQLKAEK